MWSKLMPHLISGAFVATTRSDKPAARAAPQQYPASRREDSSASTGYNVTDYASPVLDALTVEVPADWIALHL